MEVIWVIRDSYGAKIYEVVRLNGEAEVFDYISTSRRKVDTSNLFEWIREKGIVLEGR